MSKVIVHYENTLGENLTKEFNGVRSHADAQDWIDKSLDNIVNYYIVVNGWHKHMNAFDVTVMQQRNQSECE